MATFFLRAVAANLMLLGSLAAGATRTSVLLPGVQPDGSVQLPNQWSLRPVGTQIKMGDLPSNLALHPDGRFVAVLHCGDGPHEVRILDLRRETVVSQVAVAQAFYGLAWSPDGKRLYVSGAANEVIHVFSFADGYLSEPRDLRVEEPRRPEEPVREEHRRAVAAGVFVVDRRVVDLARRHRA